MPLTEDFYLGQLLYSAVKENDKTKRNQIIESARSLAQFLPDAVVEDVKKTVRDQLKEEING